MADIKHLLDDIRKNKYCVDMKETFCNALNEANANAEEIESNVKKIKDEIISINANAEIIDARCGEANLGDFNRKISSQLDNMGKELENKKYTEINLIDFSKYANIGTDDEDWSLAFDEALKTLKGQFGVIKVSKILKIKKPLILPYGVDIEGTSLPNSGFICDLNFDGDFMIKQDSDYSHVSIKKLFLNFPTGKKIGGVYLKHPYDYSCIEKIVGNNSNGDFIVVGCEKISQTLRISDCLVYACNSLTEPLVRLDNLQEAYICNNKFLGQQNSKADCDLVVCDGVATSMFINNSFASTNNCGLILKAEKYGKRINANKIIGNLFELCSETVIKLTGKNTNTGEAEYNFFIGNDSLYKQGKIELSNCTNTTVLDRLQVVNSSGARRTFNITPYNSSATDAYSNTSLVSDKGGLKGKFIGDFYFDKGRTNTSSIVWDASTTADYGLKFNIDGTRKVSFMGDNIVNEVNNGGIALKDTNGKYWVLRVDANGEIKITDY